MRKKQIKKIVENATRCSMTRYQNILCKVPVSVTIKSKKKKKKIST